MLNHHLPNPSGIKLFNAANPTIYWGVGKPGDTFSERLPQLWTRPRKYQ